MCVTGGSGMTWMRKGLAAWVSGYVLLARVTAGSELLYGRLPALSLDRQPLALTIGVHLDHPAIPSPQTLLDNFCAAVGLCME